MSVKKIVLIAVLIIIVIAVIFIAITFHQIDVIMSAGESEMPNRDDYILFSFEIRESSANALSTDEGHSQSFNFSFETMYIDSPETDGYKKIKLDETQRKNLETELLALIQTHNLQEWDGFDEHLQVMDASNGFSFNVLYENEDEIKASGGFMFPDNYIIVFKDIKEVFLKYYNNSN